MEDTINNGKGQREYLIHEDNIPRLEKKLQRIKNKCEKYGCSFVYEQTGEEYREMQVMSEAGEFQKYLARFVRVKAEGHAVMNGWTYVGSVDRTPNGNIINTVGGADVPERYYDCPPVCEHCKTKRKRTHTFIVKNEEGEYKQVGRSCLADFTGGLSASYIAHYLSLFDSLAEFEAPYQGEPSQHYVKTDFALCIIAETISKFGYVRNTYENGRNSTANRAETYIAYYLGWLRFRAAIDAARSELEQVGFDYKREAVVKRVEEAKKYILDIENPDSTYLHNLKVAASLDVIAFKNIPLLASLFPTYDRKLEQDAIRREREEKEKREAAVSKPVGSPGERISVLIPSENCVTLLTSWETMFGYMYMYKFVDKDGNVLIWKTSHYIEEQEIPDGKDIILTGTVKEHSEFNGVCQTCLNRCRIKICEERKC